jgi:hypothetical protein
MFAATAGTYFAIASICAKIASISGETAPISREI